MRRIPFGGIEHQQREIAARHVHAHSEQGTITDFGNGKTVMRVIKARPYPWVEIIGEDGLNWSGEPFNYGDFFLSEDRRA